MDKNELMRKPNYHIMRILPLLTCFFLTATVHAQLSMQWLGNNTISISNQNSCNADVRVSWLSQAGLQKDSVVTVNGGVQLSVVLPSSLQAGSEIKIKSDAPCSSNGWVKVLAISQTLPVRFVYFNLHQSGNGVLLNWQASAETVDVERSIDGIHFQAIAKNLRSSSLLDMSPMTGMNYYRLKTGEWSSPIRVIAMWEKPAMAGVFTVGGGYMAKNISSVPPGIYFIKYSDGTSRGVIKP
jgi:hypothetical protein